MFNWKGKTLLGVAALACAYSAAMPAMALDLSGKTVTWIVPFREGGGTDRLTRILAPKLAENLPGNPTVLVLNQPGGGSVTSANAFHTEAANDGTTLIMASTSTLLPVLLGSSIAKYDPNEWVAIMGFARGATMYGIADQIGVSIARTDLTSDYQALNDASLRFGTETPIAAEMLDLVSMHLLDIDARVVFGLSSKDAEAAFLRGEMNLNSDNTGSYIKDWGDDPSVVPVWSYGVVSQDGSVLRDPDLPNVPSYPEFYEAVKGEAPDGLGYQLQRAIMNTKVMLSKSIMLPSGTSDEIRDVYLDAMRKVVEDPEVVAALPREVGSMPLNFGDETQRAIAAGTEMDPAVRDWANQFLQENYDASLD